MNRFVLLQRPYFWVLSALFLLVPSPSLQAGMLSPAVKSAIEARFPNATINEVERETWQGQTVTEVELTASDGTDYEVFVAKDGEIVNISEGDSDGLPVIGGQLTIGVGVRGERDIYRDEDTEFEPVPFLVYHNGPFEIQGYDGLEASLELLEFDPVSFGVMGELDFEVGYDETETYFLGMEELETMVNAGAFIEVELAGFEIGLEGLHEVTGEHDGQEVEFSVTYPYALAGFMLRPKVSVTWMSEKTVEYLYGVSASEARPGRPAYAPGSSYEAEAELMVERALWGNFSVIGMVGVSLPGSDITDSPLVDEDVEIEGAIGIAYTF